LSFYSSESGIAELVDALRLPGTQQATPLIEATGALSRLALPDGTGTAIEGFRSIREEFATTSAAHRGGEMLGNLVRVLEASGCAKTTSRGAIQKTDVDTDVQSVKFVDDKGRSAYTYHNNNIQDALDESGDQIDKLLNATEIDEPLQKKNKRSIARAFEYATDGGDSLVGGHLDIPRAEGPFPRDESIPRHHSGSTSAGGIKNGKRQDGGGFQESIRAFNSNIESDAYSLEDSGRTYSIGTDTSEQRKLGADRYGPYSTSLMRDSASIPRDYAPIGGFVRDATSNTWSDSGGFRLAMPPPEMNRLHDVHDQMPMPMEEDSNVMLMPTPMPHLGQMPVPERAPTRMSIPVPKPSQMFMPMPTHPMPQPHSSWQSTPQPRTPPYYYS